MIVKHAKDVNGTRCDVWIRDGKIRAFGVDLPVPEGEQVIEAKGLILMPAFIDTHCHWRTPGFEYKEDIATGSAAAAAGGYTFVNLMPNTKPVCSSAEIAHEVMAKAKEIGLCDCNQTVSITKNFDGKTLDHLLELAENIETVRNCHLAEYYGTRLHMCHVSTKEAIRAIRQAQYSGARVTCEVTPHHLWFDDSRLQYKVNPPIRKADDVEALVEGIRNGTVSCIGTDHAPHTAEDKARGAAGMVGLETAFAVCYTKLCRECGLPLEHLSALMSAGPAGVLGLSTKGLLAPGFDADLVLVDIDHMFTVHADELHSKSKNCPYDGQSFYGKVMLTLKAGKETYRSADFKG